MRPLLPVLFLTAVLAGAAALVSAQPASPPAAAKPAATPKPAPAARPAATGAKAAPPAKPAVPVAARASANREGIETLEDRLDRAIDRVSAPQLLPMLGGAGRARGYRLPGYGVVVVLTPRALPGPDGPEVLRWRPRHRVHVEARRSGDVLLEDPQELEAIERQVILLQHESEQARRAAEETQQRIVETVRWRFSAPGEMTVEIAPVAPAEAPPAHAPDVPSVPDAVVPPAAPAPPAPPAPPPWKYWFNVDGPRDTRAPDAIVADVRAALVDALAAHSGRLTGLGPDESVTVAVDFEDAGRIARRPRPGRTLVVRARVRDMEARAAGAIAPEELRRRLEVLEY